LDDLEREIDLSKCTVCGKLVCFEQKWSKLPIPEYDVCNGCDDHICPDCNKSKDEDPFCAKCIAEGKDKDN